MTYFQSASVASIDALFTLLSDALVAAGATRFVLNSSTSAPAAGRIAREELFELHGTSARPTRAYIGIARVRDLSSTGQRLQLYAFTGCKGFTTAITISTISRTGTTVTVTTTGAHGLATGDRVIINGSSADGFHEGYTGTDASPATTITVTGSTTFTYTSATSGTLSGTGGYVVAVYNEAMGRVLGASAGHSIPLADSTNAVFAIADEFGVRGLSTQGGAYTPFWLAVVGRNHVPSKHAGVAFTTGTVAAGSGVAVVLDRATADLRVGQRVWLVHPTEATTERCVVATITDSTHIMLTTVVGSYPVDTLIGLDPCPVAVCGASSSTAATTNLTVRTFKFPHHVNATRTDPTTQAYTVAVESATPDDAIDPDELDDYYQAADLMLYRSTSPTGKRGVLSNWLAIPVGSQSDQDIGNPGDVATDAYKCFVSQLVAGTNNYCLGIGPGAS